MAHYTEYAHFLRSTWQLNRMALTAGTRTLVHRMAGKRRVDTWSIPYEGVLELLTLGTPSQGIDDAAQIRVPLDNAALLNRMRTAGRTPIAAEFIRGEWVARSHTEQARVVLYLHGGGYVSGSPRTHGALTAQLAQHAAARILALDYRLAPEWPFPAALEDAWTAYWWLLNQGVLPDKIVLAGDSAGGGLVLALLLSLRDAGIPLPAAGVCFSPWTDLTLTGATLAVNASTDFINRNVLAATAQMYLGGHTPIDPLVSPLFADLSGLPPLLIQAGTAEILLDDSLRLAARARQCGVPVELELWPDMMHVFQLTYLIEPRARAAVRSAGNFIRRQTPLGGASMLGSVKKEQVDAERTAPGLFN